MGVNINVGCELRAGGYGLHKGMAPDRLLTFSRMRLSVMDVIVSNLSRRLSCN